MVNLEQAIDVMLVARRDGRRGPACPASGCLLAISRVRLLEAEEGFEVLAEAGDVPTTEHALNAYRPRVLILDLTIPGESSLGRSPDA